MSVERFAVGKLPLATLQKLLGRFRVQDERVLVGPSVGEDAAAIDFGDRCLVAKTDPITFATDEIGWYAVNVNANDIACRGATPKWFLATILLPEGQADEAMAEGIFAQIADACAELNVAVVGGHTEITYGLERPLVIGQMLGEVARERLVTTAGAQVGDAVVLTKGIPVEGASLIAREKEADLLARGVSPALIATAKNLLRNPGISVVREALLAANTVEVHALHDPTEGGLATGLHEVALAAKVGLRVDADAIPVLDEGRALCALYGLDPMGTIASGALVLTLPASQVERLLQAFAVNHVRAAVIGEVVPAERGVRWRPQGRESPLPLFTTDEITKLFA